MSRVIEYKVGNLYQISHGCILKCVSVNDDSVWRAKGIGRLEVLIPPEPPIPIFDLHQGNGSHWRQDGKLDSTLNDRPHYRALDIVKVIEP